ncbi:hypothetical protein GCK72_016440 [Caenorhabditis remanei]|uniref:Uncharacterized protein n=1 Tax=Caenorhabditis remanei TaxID=31234 RepID=A0A6A5G5F1_CAERE|nr:hypothetical protein GCK72_016440 [Caenorhabditis remanei]KAF1749895.1 hypothetical protein GCK72_016440 [Caenorhabditis remanei]
MKAYFLARLPNNASFHDDGFSSSGFTARLGSLTSCISTDVESFILAPILKSKFVSKNYLIAGMKSSS